MTKANDQNRWTPPVTSSARGRTSRAKLIAAAVELIPEVGWNAVTTRLVAARAEVRPGLVHYHFHSLEALLRAAVDSALTGVLDGPLSAMTAAANPAEGVTAALGAMDAHSGEDPASVLFAEAYLAASRDPELHTTMSRILLDVRSAMTVWLTDHGTPQPEAVAELLCAFLDGIVLHRALIPVPGPRAYAEPLRRLLSAPGGEEDAR
ncbi:TetR family transcriptional regulator [Nocardiopsis sp. CNR-923]|uniref:TetR/AcrR family transcriptional regulator n=1 Tax=Nocardiopsis sp. CNR-923 TaxID=1904965 RepID=UPI000959075B|nr:TetR family transcriptional regulator [Nocardiopsis sp. CNR-923]OLT30645.1 TetR family transcriptional regulator [Nocardiopsis sp. CNR-923]